jgi:acyl phosphate:glycerol-3-phosphate acyltransferase
MSDIVLKTVVSYLLGGLMGSLLVGRLRGGVDIRQLGSGNAGGTNALRTQGRAFAFWVMLIDIAKGFIATRLIAPLNLPGLSQASPVLREWLPALCGIAVVVGHVYPAWYGFRGGKGVAALLGALAGLNSLLLLPVVATWLLVVFLTGYVGLASITAALVLPVYILLSRSEPAAPLLAFAVAIAAIVLFKHRSNIARMRKGHEPRARKFWLLGRNKA